LDRSNTRHLDLIPPDIGIFDSTCNVFELTCNDSTCIVDVWLSGRIAISAKSNILDVLTKSNSTDPMSRKNLISSEKFSSFYPNILLDIFKIPKFTIAQGRPRIPAKGNIPGNHRYVIN